MHTCDTLFKEYSVIYILKVSSRIRHPSVGEKFRQISYCTDSYYFRFIYGLILFPPSLSLSSFSLVHLLVKKEKLLLVNFRVTDASKFPGMPGKTRHYLLLTNR